MLLDVSIGESIDKYVILEIKNDNINDVSKKLEINKEMSMIHIPSDITKTIFYNSLKHVNKQIWDQTDTIKALHYTDSNYAKLSYDLFNLNQTRFRIKNMINKVYSSHINEQKSYDGISCDIIIQNECEIYDKISEINFLLTQYDNIYIDTQYKSIIQNIFKSPTVYFHNQESVCTCKIILDKFEISEDIKKIYEMPPLKYASAGKLGDFIHVLSIVNENYYKTGRKGIIYMWAEQTWSNGINNTYTDIYNLIMSQKYVYDLKIHSGESIDINLDEWFHRKDLLYHTNWYKLFNETYNVEWGNKKWLTIDYHEKWSDKILINVMHYRPAKNIDYNKLFELYSPNLIFIGFDEKSYEVFKNDSGLSIEYYKPSSFTDLCIAVNSCKLLVGGLSAILCIGHAMHKDRVIGLSGNNDDIHNLNFHSIWNNVSYNV